MTAVEWTLVGVAVTLAVYAAFVLALVVAGRRSDARALAAFIPDCIVLFGRLLTDPARLRVEARGGGRPCRLPRDAD